jgi:RNA polymerase sigma-70 factor (ECF subfamily)
MQRALLKLSPGERDILTLVVSGDLNYREIGAMIGITEANVKVRVHRARVKLKNLMGRANDDGRTHQHVYR